MTMSDPERLGPQDFDGCFADEPDVPDATADLARGRRRRRRIASLGVSGVTAVAALTCTVTLAALPAHHAAPVVASPGPSTPQRRPSVVPSAVDTAPPLRYSDADGYLDAKGLVQWDNGPYVPRFSATEHSVYDLMRLHLDPEHVHLAPYKQAGTIGGGMNGGIAVGLDLPWRVKGSTGQGTVVVMVTRAAPDRQPVTRGQDRDGVCANRSGSDRCRAAVVDGRHIFLDRLPGGGFVVDYVQPDGELASAEVQPRALHLDGVPRLKNMDISLTAVLDLLADPNLDVIG